MVMVPLSVIFTVFFIIKLKDRRDRRVAEEQKRLKKQNKDPDNFSDLTDEEKSVYECELWKKISVLLKKSRKTLMKSIEAAKKIGEENEYIDKSLEMIKEIDSIYEEKENTCKN